jgi:hypothetical protein
MERGRYGTEVCNEICGCRHVSPRGQVL